MSKALLNALWILPLALFNAIFFTIGATDYSTTQWISYGFITLAFLMIPATAFTQPSTKGMTILSGTMWVRLGVYLIAALVAGIIFMVSNSDDPAWPALIQSAIVVIFLVWQISAVLANRSTTQSIEKQRQESLNVRMLQEQLKNCGRSVSDAAMRHQIFSCADSVGCLPIESFPQTQIYELELRNAVNALCNAVEMDQASKAVADAIAAVMSAGRNLSSAVKLSRLN